MNELYHHQIKGAKWGVMNGPPYPLNPEDHSKAELKANPTLQKQAKMAVKEEKEKRRNERRGIVFTRKATKALKKGNDEKIKERAKSMSKEELDAAIARLTKEKQYVDLQKALNPEAKKRESIVKDMVKKALSDVGTKALTQVLTTGWNNAMTNAGHSELKIMDKNSIAKALKGASKTVNGAQKNKEEKPKKEEPKKETQKNDKKSSGADFDGDRYYANSKKDVPASYKLTPKIGSDGTIKWVMPSDKKKKNK